MGKIHNDYIRSSDSKYIRGYNALYDNLPEKDTFIGGMALIHIIKRVGKSPDIYDDYWVNLICDEVNKTKFIQAIKVANKKRKKDIEEIVKKSFPVIMLIRLYYHELSKLDTKFYIGNPQEFMKYE
jgi:hypothetical protein